MTNQKTKRKTKRKSRRKGKTKTQNRGIRIAGTLLAYYRTRRNLTQPTFAERLHVSVDELRNCEQGDQSTDFINRSSGLVADILHLTRPEMLALQSATRADDFLHDIRQTRETERDYQHKARMFQSLLLQPESEPRRWFRVAFAHNRLREEFADGPVDGSKQGRAPKRLDVVLDLELVAPEMLVTIRRAMREACELAHREKTDLKKISQLLLYRARSVASLDSDDPDRKQVLKSLQEMLQESQSVRLEHIVDRHLAHALCEVGDENAMCNYLLRTDANKLDSRENLEFLLQRSADAGDGLQSIECILNFIKADTMKQCMPLCALDLRTAAQLIAEMQDKNGARCSSALQNLLLTATLAQKVAAFVKFAQPLWCAKHQCHASAETCQDVADRYARRILESITEFTAALPQVVQVINSSVRSAMVRESG